jgi:PadR family transcriptional regulator, regulatory protein PadR
MHGWAIAVRIQQVSNEQLQVQKGSLDAARHRLKQQGLKQQGRISKAGARPNGRRARPFGRRSFMPSPPWGRKQLEAEMANWNRPSAAIDLIVAER